MISSLLMCASLVCPWTAELGLHWDESPGAEGYRLYVSSPSSPTFHYLWADELACCEVYPARLLLDEAFPIEPGELGNLIFRVAAYNEFGESGLSEPVGIVSDQRIILPGSR